MESLPVSWEAIGVGKQIAGIARRLINALVFGQHMMKSLSSFQYGADKVIQADDAT